MYCYQLQARSSAQQRRRGVVILTLLRGVRIVKQATAGQERSTALITSLTCPEPSGRAARTCFFGYPCWGSRSHPHRGMPIATFRSGCITTCDKATTRESRPSRRAHDRSEHDVGVVMSARLGRPALSEWCRRRLGNEPE
jgi:hypothetical protein